MGPAMISSENVLLRGSVLLNVRGRDVGSFVEQAQRAVLIVTPVIFTWLRERQIRRNRV